MNKKFGLLAIIGLTTACLVLAYLAYSGQKRTGFIDYNTVYNNCKLKKDLEKDLEGLTNKRKGELDSLQLQLSFLSQEVEAGQASNEKLTEFENLKNRFLTLKQQYEEENLRLKEAYFNQIRKDLNDKAKSYASANGYDYLFAAMGDGALMYGAESEDVTKDFQDFVDKNQ